MHYSNVSDDSTLHFAIKSNGEDLDSITILSMYCILNALTIAPDQYTIRIPSTQRFVVCDIMHHASMTEHLLSYLETVLDGVYFMAHYHLPNSIIDEDDAELLYISRQLITHPICNANDMYRNKLSLDNENSIERRVATRITTNIATTATVGGEGWEYKDTSDSYLGGRYSYPRLDTDERLEVSISNDYKTGQGSLIGLDLDIISRSLIKLDDNADIDSDNGCNEDNKHKQLSGIDSISYDLISSLRPIKERINFFSSIRKEDYDEAIDLFAMIHKVNASISALNHLSDDDGSIDGLDINNNHLQLQEEEEEEEALASNNRIRNTEKLDLEYQNAQLKIVDLGNACWIDKHFTDDIQTRYIYIFIIYY